VDAGRRRMCIHAYLNGKEQPIERTGRSMAPADLAAKPASSGGRSGSGKHRHGGALAMRG
jgi:hypothetical protein